MAEKLSYEALKKRVAELEFETRKHAQVEAQLQYRLKFEALITTISSKFINLPPDEIDTEISIALKEIAEFTQVDRGYIFRYRNGAAKMDNTHEWCAKGINAQIQRLKGIPLNILSWLTNQLNAAQVVHIPRVEDLPAEAIALKEENLRQGTKSLIMVPTKYGGSVIGFLGLDSVRSPKTWTPDAIALLRIVGEILANAVERKRSEEALRQSEEKYRTILETLEEAYWEVDLEGNFTFFSPSACRVLGYTHEELMGMNYRGYNSPEVSRKMSAVFNSIYKTDKRMTVTDYEHITKSGKIIIAEMSTSLMRDAQGKPIGFRGISRDVTERKLAEQALLESQERYRTVLEANPDPVVVCDINGHVVYFNPAFAEVFGWNLNERMGKIMDGFVPEEKQPEMKMMAEQVMAGQSFSGIETSRYTNDGSLIPVSISGAVYKSTNGKPMGSVITLRDIREKKKLEHQLLNIHKLESIGTLAGGIAHDFNNLLMAVQGNISLALFDLDENHPHRRIFENIQKIIKSGSRLTSQLLGFARKGRYEVKPLDLNRVTKDVAETFGRTRKEISIQFHLATDLPAVEADEGQLEQVLLNIFVNAGQAMPAGGEISLKTGVVTHHQMTGRLYLPKPGSYVMLVITDTGNGMDKHVMTHIFEPFFTTKEMGRGTGLGLASAYGIVKGHGGYIDVDSEPGHGATFSIYLPASTKTVPTTLDIRMQAVSGVETILLVDDEEMVLDIGEKLLSRLGYNVLKARNGKEAVEVYGQRKSAIDLIILDVIMPVMSGGDAFDRIKEINPKAKILLSSGYSVDGQVGTIMDRGCDGFIQKPFKLEILSTRLREILEVPSIQK